MNHPNRGKNRHDSPTPKEVGILRGCAGYTQREAAQIVHVSEKAWSMWEQGMRPMPPGLWELYRIKTRHRMGDTARGVRMLVTKLGMEADDGLEFVHPDGAAPIRAATWAALAAKVLERRRAE